MNAEQDRRIKACVRLERKEGTKHSLLACYEEFVRQNIEVEMACSSFNYSVLPCDNLHALEVRSIALVKVQYNTRRATPAPKFLNGETKTRFDTTVVERNVRIVVMQILARLFHSTKESI
jgi:hypothetical protein